jgi:hypothetical protein
MSVSDGADNKPDVGLREEFSRAGDTYLNPDEIWEEYEYYLKNLISSNDQVKERKLDSLRFSGYNFDTKSGHWGFAPRSQSSIDHNLVDINLRSVLSTLYDDYQGIMSLELPKKLTNLRQELVRFNFALKSWWTANRWKSNTKFTPDEIWRRSMFEGPQFADTYQKQWDKDVRIWHDALNPREKGTTFQSYDQYFPIRQFFRWSEQADDLKYYQIHYSISDEDLELMTQLIYDFLPEEIDLPNDEEILSEVRLTSSYNSLENEREPNFKSKLFKDNCFADNLSGIRTSVYVYPTGTRDTIVLQTDSLNTIQWCSRMTSNILSNINESLLGHSGGFFNKRIKEMKRSQKDEYYYLPDIRKAGITQPRVLFNCIREALVRKFGPNPKFDRYLAYENFHMVDNEGQKIDTCRGVGLGMQVNELTLFLCAIHKLRCIEVPCITDGLYFNDDQTIKFTCSPEELEDTVNLLREVDIELCNRFGFILHESKTFCSSHFIMLEQYTMRDFSDKSTATAALFGHAFAMPEIWLAKEYMISVPQLRNERFDDIFKSLIDFWGYEFDPGEAQRDYFLGGWDFKKSRYQHLILEDIMDLDDQEVDYLSYVAEMVSLRSYSRIYLKTDNLVEFTCSATKLGKINEIEYIKYIEDDRLRSLSSSIVASEDDLFAFYNSLHKKLKKPDKFIKKYHKLKGKIKERFFKSSCREDLINFILEHYPTKSYRIPEKLVDQQSINYVDLKSIDKGFNFLKRENESLMDHLMFILKKNGNIRTNKDFEDFVSSESYLQILQTDF